MEIRCEHCDTIYDEAYDRPHCPHDLLPPKTGIDMSRKWLFRKLSGPDSRGMGYVSQDGEDILHAGSMGLSTAENLTIGLLAASAPALQDAAEVFILDLENAAKDETRAIDLRVHEKRFRAALALANEETE